MAIFPYRRDELWKKHKKADRNLPALLQSDAVGIDDRT
jgi:hypothetical protein